jgi:hypothetical protein
MYKYCFDTGKQATLSLFVFGLDGSLLRNVLMRKAILFMYSHFFSRAVFITWQKMAHPAMLTTLRVNYFVPQLVSSHKNYCVCVCSLSYRSNFTWLFNMIVKYGLASQEKKWGWARIEHKYLEIGENDRRFTICTLDQILLVLSIKNFWWDTNRAWGNRDTKYLARNPHEKTATCKI